MGLLAKAQGLRAGHAASASVRWTPCACCANGRRLFGVHALEAALFASGRVDVRLKTLAQVKTSALIGCPF